MPHINKSEQEAILKRELFPNQPGQLCWLFAKWMLEEYNKAPKWTTIHEIRKRIRSPMSYNDTRVIVIQFGSSYTTEDVLVAADLAFIEFYRLVGAAHEDVKIRTNGNALEGAMIPNE